MFPLRLRPVPEPRVVLMTFPQAAARTPSRGSESRRRTPSTSPSFYLPALRGQSRSAVRRRRRPCYAVRRAPCPPSPSAAETWCALRGPDFQTQQRIRRHESAALPTFPAVFIQRRTLASVNRTVRSIGPCAVPNCWPSVAASRVSTPLALAARPAEESAARTAAAARGPHRSPGPASIRTPCRKFARARAFGGDPGV